MDSPDRTARAGLSEPLQRFGKLLERAMQTDLPEPTAVALATSTPAGRPSVRMVLLKGFDERGFVFYTNLRSRKARELSENPHAALCFHWQPLEVQVRVEGVVEPVSTQEADAYFATRPEGSRLGAWASRQSARLDSVEELEDAIRQVAARFGGGEIPRPPFWSGYRVRPGRMEFWTARPDRLHLREVYERGEETDNWTTHKLQP